MKKVLSLFLSVLMLTSVVAAVDLSAYAATVTSGACGSKLTWELDTNGTLSISGTGKMYDYDDYGNYTPWYSYNPNAVLNVTISEGVTSLGTYAFAHCSNLLSASIPNSLTELGDYAFAMCTNLLSITLPEGIPQIGMFTFYKCTSLTSVTIPYGVNSIEFEAFKGCTSLTSVTISNSLTTIGSYSFSGCSNLQKVIVPSSVTQILSGAFNDCVILTAYYTGSKSNWNKIDIGNYNDCLLEARIYHDYTCSSHNWNSAMVTKKATNDKNGTLTYNCKVCESTKKSTIYKIKSMSLSTSSYTYNAKAKKPTVTIRDSNGSKINSKYYTVSYISQSTGKKVSSMKNPGKYYVKVTFKTRYSGSIKKAVTIKPKKTSIKSIKASKKGFTVKWGKVSTQNTGYQIQYSTSKSFKNAKTATVKKTGTTSKKITKLKAKKKYYVRVRTYKTVKVNGKSTKLYSAWSSTKGVTTKK